MNAFFYVTAFVLLLASALPLSRNKIWWVRMCDFPRLQILILTVIWLLLWILFALFSKAPSLILVLVMIVSLCYQLLWIYPYTSLHPHEVPDAVDGDDPKNTLKILVCNVLTSNRNATRLKSLVSEYSPDIIATLESDQWWQDQLDTMQAYSHRLAVPLDNLYGMHVYSKMPLLNASINYVVEKHVPSMRFEVQMYSGENIKLFIVHPAPPAPGENNESTERDVELLLLAKELANCNDKIIVTGDLNDVAWSATTRLFRQISGLLDLRVGRGLFNSFHANHWFARWPLDHIFVSKHFRVAKIRKLPHVGSDHFPIYVELTLGNPHTLDISPSTESVDEQLVQETLETDAAQNALNQRT